MTRLIRGICFSIVIATFVAASTNSVRAQSNAKGESQFATLDGARIHYVNYGQGSEALVLVHGWTCSVGHWRDQVPDLAKRNRVIAIDLLGHGKSDKPQITYNMNLFASVIDAVLQHAKVERAVLMGHSMGTPVARQFYRRYPQKTAGLIIVDGALAPFGNKAMFDNILTNLRGPDYETFLRQMFAGMKGPNLSAEAQERIATSTKNTPQHVIVSAMEGMADDSIWGKDKINVPTLAIMAKNPMFPADIEQQYKVLAPDLDFQIWEGVGHFLMMEKPKEFNAAVITFLDKKKLLKKSV